MYFSNFADLFKVDEYLVSTVLKSGDYWFWIFLSFFALNLIVVILMHFFKSFLSPDHHWSKFISMLAPHLWVVGSFGLFYFVMRQIQIAFLGAGFWLIFISIYFIFIVYLIIKHFWIFYPINKDYYNQTKEKLI